MRLPRTFKCVIYRDLYCEPRVHSCPHRNRVLIVLAQAPPITAISFALIVLRVGFERAFSSWLGPPAAPSGSGMTSALRTPGGEHPVRITCESTFVDSDVDKDKDRESVEVKRPTLRGRANVSEAVV